MNQKIEEKIKQGIKDKSPKTKWFFYSKSLLKDILLFALWVLLVVIVGFVFNIFIELRYVWPSFAGKIPILGLLSMVPIEFLTLIIGLVVIIYFLFKNIGFFYRMSSLLIIVIILASIFIGFFVYQQAGLNGLIINSTPAEKLFHRQGRPFYYRSEGFVGGVVTDCCGKNLIFVTPEGKYLRVIISDTTRIPDGISFDIGDRIWVFGTIKEDKIEADIIHKVRNQPGQGRNKGKKIMIDNNQNLLYGNNLN